MRLKLKASVLSLFGASDAQRVEIAEDIVQTVKSNCTMSKKDNVFCEFTALIIEYLLSYLLSIKSSSESGYYQYLSLLNHIPITPDSPFYQTLYESLLPDLHSDSTLIELFNQLQVLFLVTEHQDFATAKLLAAKLEPAMQNKQLKLLTIYNISMGQILRSQDDYEKLLLGQLIWVIEVYQKDSPESAIYFLLRWIYTNSWDRHNLLKKALLMGVYNNIGDKKTLNSSIVLYELFTMEDRLVPATEKLAYQKKLIRFPSSILNTQQLQRLYFFAGAYNCGIQSKLAESIQNYHSSNYLMHKKWERLLHISRFLRQYLDPETYLTTLPSLENRIQELSNRVSFQNNAFVESLQTVYVKIESLYEKVEELSITDSLTGLRNRRYLDNNLYQMVVLAARHKMPVSFSMIDIDFFKHVNDTHGHLTGDYILKELAKIFTGKFRQSDIIIRYGGEEFLIILFGVDQIDSLKHMEDLRLEIQNHSFVHRNHVIPITISIGVFCDDNHELKHLDMNKLISYSDKAMYQAKTAGRNCVLIWDPNSSTDK